MGRAGETARMPHRALLLAWTVATVLSARSSLAQTPSPTVASVVELARTPPGKGQASVGIGRRGSHLYAAHCSRRCNWDSAIRLQYPATAFDESQSIRSVQVSRWRRVVVLQTKAAGPGWASVVAGTTGTSPKVLFDGAVGLPDVAKNQAENQGAAQSATVVEVLEGNTFAQVVMGTVDSELNLCGRQALLRPQMIVADAMEWRRIKYQRLSQGVRAQATPVRAQPRASQPPFVQLEALGASSGGDSVQALVDGDASTVWTENASGDGSGEFVVLRVPSAVPLSTINLTFPSASRGTLTPPARAWLVTDDAVLDVTFEPAGSDNRTNSYQLHLPAPTKTSCLALVLNAAGQAAPAGQAPSAGQLAGQSKPAVHPKARAADAESASRQPLRVAVSEVSVTAALSGAEVAQWVEQLGAEGAVGDLAERNLSALGLASVSEIARRFSELPSVGQGRALNVLDAVPCIEVAAVYAEATRGEFSARAAAQLRRCGPEAAEKVAAVASSSEPALMALAELLAELSPGVAVKRLVPLLKDRRRDARRLIRRVLYELAVAKSADQEIIAQFRSKLHRRAAIDLMRALGDQLPRFRNDAVPQLLELVGRRASFRTRYLLVQPAAALAPSDRRVVPFLVRTMSADRQPDVRARAARVAPAQGELLARLIQAATDEQMRVRLAAIENLGEQRVSGAQRVLVDRLESDAWPVVRAQAARALASLGQSAATDDALAEAASEDLSPHVRRPAVIALGRRQTRSQLDVVRLTFREDVDPHVRAAAAESLGALCDTQALPELTEHALALTRFDISAEQGILGRSALNALGRIQPSNLKATLAPFFSDKVPTPTRYLAEAALDHPAPCAAQPEARR